jgi:hypothetical protein
MPAYSGFRILCHVLNHGNGVAQARQGTRTLPCLVACGNRIVIGYRVFVGCRILIRKGIIVWNRFRGNLMVIQYRHRLLRLRHALIVRLQRRAIIETNHVRCGTDCRLGQQRYKRKR